MFLKDYIIAIHDVFSQRKAHKTEQNTKMVSSVDRTRILLLYRDIITGKWEGLPSPEAEMFWDEVHNLLEHRLGRPVLSQSMQRIGIHDHRTVVEDVYRFLSECTSDEFLDFIELSFKVRHPPQSRNGPSAAIEAVNEVFRQGNLPYRLTDYATVEEELERLPLIDDGTHRRGASRTVVYPRIIVAEDEVTHEEAVEPALAILGCHQFAVANTEFRDGLEHYRRGRYLDCLTNCGSALESVLKVICDRKRWNYNDRATLGTLLDLVISQLGLEPVFAQKFNLLTTIRNRRSSSHGGGGSPRVVEPHLAQYMVTATAATIVFLVNEADAGR